jgi:hypothetical protein
MKPFIPQIARRRIIKNPIIPPLVKAAPLSPMTVVKLPPVLLDRIGRGPLPGIAPLIARRNGTDILATVYLARSYVFSGQAPASFVNLGTTKSFAMTGTLAEQALATPTGGLIVQNKLPAGFSFQRNPERITIQLSGVDLILSEVSDFEALADSTLLFCGNEIMSIAEAEMTAKGAYTLMVLRGRFETPIETHNADAPIWITSTVKAFQHPFFATGNIATFKITIGQQSLADATPFEIKL